MDSNNNQISNSVNSGVLDNERATSYNIFLVKQFTGPYYFVPSAGAKAYISPSKSSQAVYTFTPPIGTYIVNSVVFSNKNYWLKFLNLTPSCYESYVLCDDVNFDYAQYIAQTPNSKIGSNSNVIFNMWYYPNPKSTTKITGVQWPTPLFYQYYYVNGERKNSYKCTLMASISGYYCYNQKNDDPTTFLNNMTAKYWNDASGMSWSSFMTAQTKSSITQIITEVKKSLDLNKPITVGASNGSIDHMVLVVGYKNSGSNRSDYIVLDSCQNNLSDLDAFFKSYPKVVATWNSTKGGYMYGTFM